MRELLEYNFRGWKAYGQFPEGPAPIGTILNFDTTLTSLTLEVSDGRGHDHKWKFSSLAWSCQVKKAGEKAEVTITKTKGAYDDSYGPESMMARIDTFILAPIPAV